MKPSDQLNFIYFNKARTALKYGLTSLGLKEGDEILVPDFICDSIFQPIIQNSLVFQTYALMDNLEPDWASIGELLTHKTKGILMVHYFGQPQDVNKFITFAETNKLFLIEDNAHGHGGLIGEKVLGSFGDIGISSPRKFLNISDGGKLYFKQKNNYLANLSIDYAPLEPKPLHLGKYLNKFPKIKNKLRMYIKKRPNYENPLEFKESFVEDLLISKDVVTEIESLDWKGIASKRREKFKHFRDLALEKGLQPVFEEPYIQSNPWCFAAYTSSETESAYWFDWGWRNNISIFSWPTLRKEQINKGNAAFKRWKRLICFSTSA